MPCKTRALYLHMAMNTGCHAVHSEMRKKVTKVILGDQQNADRCTKQHCIIPHWFTGSQEFCSGFSICSLSLPQQPAAPPVFVFVCTSVCLERVCMKARIGTFVRVVYVPV